MVTLPDEECSQGVAVFGLEKPSGSTIRGPPGAEEIPSRRGFKLARGSQVHNDERHRREELLKITPEASSTDLGRGGIFPQQSVCLENSALCSLWIFGARVSILKSCDAGSFRALSVENRQWSRGITTTECSIPTPTFPPDSTWLLLKSVGLVSQFRKPSQCSQRQIR